MNRATLQKPYTAIFRYLPLILFFLAASVQASEVSVATASPKGIAETVRGDDSTSHGFVASALHWYDSNMNYAAVGVLMTVESSFIPFPSEVVIPPAVYVASNPESQSGMKIWLIVLVGTLGALLGAYINYFLSRWLGRPIIYKLVDSRVGHLFLLNREKLERAENYFNAHGNVSTLIGRLIPVVRQLISIPAGLAKMNVLHFTLFTLVGAGIWNSILALIGYLAYQAADPSVIERYSHQLSIAILALLAVAIVYAVTRFFIKRKRGRRQSVSPTFTDMSEYKDSQTEDKREPFDGTPTLQT